MLVADYDGGPVCFPRLELIVLDILPAIEEMIFLIN
jgi:hypothetical protein